MAANAFQASASTHQPRRLVITEESSLDAITPASAYVMAPVEDAVEVRP